MTAKKMAAVLFSGTADELQAAATLVSGAAAMDMEVHVFLTSWALHAFRRDVIDQPLPLSPGYGELTETMAMLMKQKGVPPWHQLLRMARSIGDVRIHACSMTTDLMGLQQSDLDDLVDDVIGIATMIDMTDGAQLMFI